MAYEKKTWECGETITAEALNHIENGINNNASMMVTATFKDYAWTLDKTFGEIRTAYDSGRLIFIKMSETHETDMYAKTSCVINVDYHFSDDGEYASAYGQVATIEASFSVSVAEPPYTLEALDAQYPYYGD